MNLSNQIIESIDWTQLIQNTSVMSISLLIVGGLITFLMKKYGELILKRDLEFFKNNLKKEVIGFEIQYSKLHKERAEVVKNLYQKIVKTHMEFKELMNIWAHVEDLPTEEDDIKADKVAADMKKFYEKNKIFFNKSELETIDKVMNDFKKAWNKYKKYRIEGESEKGLKSWKEAWEIIDTETPKVKRELESIFREAIGLNKK